MAQVRLEAVTKQFGDTIAVRDVNLDVADREFMVLVGPSGCGKTTTLRMVAGLETTSGGTIHIGERRVDNVAAKDRDIAMVFQNYALYPHMTVRDNMGFGLRQRRTPSAEVTRRVRDAAEILGLGDLLPRFPRELSGGQRQRVALGRAIVRRPSVFLMDEPLSNLDAKLRVQMRTELSRIHRQLDTTFIYVTHDQVEAMTMGQRIVVMRDGCIQQVASPTDLYYSPANLFVAGFMGSPGMNFLRGRLSTDGGVDFFVSDDVRIRLTAAPWGVAQDVVLGIRPEDVRLDPQYVAAHADTRIDMGVDVVEMLGAEQYVYLSSGSLSLIARATPDLHMNPGDRVTASLAPERIHLFDAKSERVLV